MKRALIVCALLLGSCGRDLGNYQVESAKIVNGEEQKKEAALWQEPLRLTMPFPFLLRVTISSNTNIRELIRSNYAYVDADFCPMRVPFRIGAIGDLTFSQIRKDNRYLYTTYIIPSYPMLGVTYADLTRPQYDLRRQHQDVCLRIEDPQDYVLFPSRSSVFRLREQIIEAAFAASAKSGKQQAGVQ